MGIGTSIFLIAVGAILHWAVTGHVEGLRIETMGTILMVIGIIGLVISLFYTTLWASRDRHGDPTLPPRTY
jgi:uncharacterized membrane protein YvlD (DUF360 family)